MNKFLWLDSYLNHEIVILLIILASLGGIVAFYSQKNAPFDRKKFFKRTYKKLSWQLLLLASCYLGFIFTHDSVRNVIGLFTFIYGAYLTVRIFRIWISLFLFLRHPHTGVPVLLIEFGTIFYAFFVSLVILNNIFQVNLTSLLATSAVLSLVLGLALQETLGNIFAGFSFSISPAFEIGDYIEVRSGNGVVLGKVDEMNWRAVIIRSLANEMISIPNKVISSAHIVNLTHTPLPVFRSFMLKVSQKVPIDQVKQIVNDFLIKHPKISQYPEKPGIFLTEINESGLIFRVIFCPKDLEFVLKIVDEIICEAISKLPSQLYPASYIEFIKEIS